MRARKGIKATFQQNSFAAVEITQTETGNKTA
jgi:hypothetical protein